LSFDNLFGLLYISMSKRMEKMDKELEAMLETIEILQDAELMEAIREGMKALQDGEIVSIEEARRALGMV
jgi:hypothetical protein